MPELSRNADSVRPQTPSTDSLKTSGFPPIEQSQNTEILCKKMSILTQLHTLYLYLSDLLLHRAISSALKLTETPVQ